MSHKGSVIIFELSEMHIKSKCLSETVVVFHELCRTVSYPISKNENAAFFFFFQFCLGCGGAQKFNLITVKVKVLEPTCCIFYSYCLKSLVICAYG